MRRSNRARTFNPALTLYDVEGLPGVEEPAPISATGCNRSALALQGCSTVCGLCQEELPPEAFGTRAKGYRNTYCISCHCLLYTSPSPRDS